MTSKIWFYFGDPFVFTHAKSLGVAMVCHLYWMPISAIFGTTMHSPFSFYSRDVQWGVAQVAYFDTLYKIFMTSDSQEIDYALEGRDCGGGVCSSFCIEKMFFNKFDIISHPSNFEQFSRAF